MIDADIESNAGPCRELALDAAARGRGEILRKQRRANLLVPVRSARRADQRTVLFAATEVLGRNEAAFPEARPGVPGDCRIVGETRLRAAVDAQREAKPNQLLIQAHLVALDAADAEVPFPRSLVRSEIVAADVAATDQPGQLIARLDPAGPGIGVI